ncbi:MAG: PTS sugar transporter subunit IIB [Longicatena sp.]
MVELLRVDERLLHGQVAVTWANAIAPDAILVANDEAATNEMSKLALKMAKPNGVKLAIKTMNDAAVLLNNPNAQKLKIFVITRTIEDALKLVRTSDQIHRINIGGVKKREGGKMIAAGIFLNDEDLSNLKDLISLVEEVEVRMVPSESKTDINKLLK